jgi:hypothetical protein
VSMFGRRARRCVRLTCRAPGALASGHADLQDRGRWSRRNGRAIRCPSSSYLVGA